MSLKTTCILPPPLTVSDVTVAFATTFPLLSVISNVLGVDAVFKLIVSGIVRSK